MNIGNLHGDPYNLLLFLRPYSRITTLAAGIRTDNYVGMPLSSQIRDIPIYIYIHIPVDIHVFFFRLPRCSEKKKKASVYLVRPIITRSTAAYVNYLLTAQVAINLWPNYLEVLLNPKP